MKKFLLLSSIFVALSIQSSFAIDTYDIPGAEPAFRFSVYNEGETIVDEDSGASQTSTYTLSENQKSALFDAATNWKFIINNNNIYVPDKLPTFVVITEDIFNASAGSEYVDVGENFLITAINAYINQKTPTTPSSPQGLISVGKGLIPDYPGWNYYTGSTALYQATNPDLYSTMVHEIYHAMGLITNAGKHVPGDQTFYFSKDAYSKIGIWDSGLRIYQGPLNTTFDSDKILAANRGMSIKIDEDGTGTFDIVNNSPYFAGLKTLQVLTGDNSTDENHLQEIIYNKGGLVNYSSYYADNDDDLIIENPKVLGLPVNVIEENKPELSHIELRNSFMSHQMYQNWAILMEAELAVLKDIGYTDVELRDFFGKSYYLNGTVDNFVRGYGEWNESTSSYIPDSYSTIMNGIGLHIYSDNNFITQNCNTLSNGKYTIGTRIDGVNNTYTLDHSLIDVQGSDSIGIAVAWGKGHNIVVDGSSSVVASGENGIGVSFDFGKNVCGGMADDRGSYSSYIMKLKTNTTPDKDTQGALISNFDINGYIEGKKAAIYISENALVDQININNGATIKGNIISKWNSIQSGAHMTVMRQGTDEKWYPVDKEKIEEIYFTNLNLSGNTTIDGNIDGSNDIFNTLKISNTGNMNFKGNDMSVYLLNNTGTINFSNMTTTPELSIQDGYIKGNGILNFQNGINLASIRNIENTVNVGDNTLLSLLDGNASQININQLNANNVDLYIDFGDTFVLQNASPVGFNTLNLKQIAVDQSHADSLDSTESVQLFEATSPTTITINTLDLGSSANFYYKNNKYNFVQSATDKSILSITKTPGTFELADAIADTTAANYIVNEDESITKNLGTVNGGYFEISGDEINVAGHTGLVVDGNTNEKTVLKTDIYGASDSNITLINKANLVVTGKDDIQIGKNGETALTINDSSIEVELEKDGITFGGDIKGLGTNTQNMVIASAASINIDSVDNVVLATKSKTLNVKNTLTNTIWQIEDQNINILNDSYLSSNGTNTIVYNEGLLNLANNKASDITLNAMTLNTEMETNIDVDLGTLQTDRFVFNNTNNLVTNNNDLSIQSVNILNPNSTLTKENYFIPFFSPEYKNANFLGHISFNDSKNITTPVFNYNLDFTEDTTLNKGGFSFSRGKTRDYNSYNPAIVASPVAAQMGGYLSQLNSYEQAFQNLDMKMLMTREERQAFNMANRYASEVQPRVFSPTYLPEKDKGAWFRPYATFEKVGLSNGPKVESISYGSYFGGDSPMFSTKNGWDYQYSFYAGYNGSHQNYSGNSIYQNGGTLGLTGIWYKGDFFTSLTANVGAGVADASTMYGSEDITMFMTGVASKTGYNWELAKGKFIIQPSFLMSYSFVNTFDYTNAAGVKIKSDPLNAINIAPGLKFIGNLKNGWQPYIGMQMVWNIMDKTDFRANDVALPDMSVKPYFQYGIGIQKRWGEKFTGFFQTMFRNGGRTGIALSLGFRWTFGK